MTPGSDALVSLLHELRAVAPAGSAPRIDELERRPSSSALRRTLPLGAPPGPVTGNPADRPGLRDVEVRPAV